MSSTLVNPLTGRIIREGGITHRKVEKQLGMASRPMQFATRKLRCMILRFSHLFFRTWINMEVSRK